MKLSLLSHAGSFAEDKDIARKLRKESIEPALEAKERVTLDFKGVQLATQSFIHALIADLIRTRGPGVLDRIEFKGCNASLKSLIKVVTEYSQEDVSGEDASDANRRRRTQGKSK